MGGEKTRGVPGEREGRSGTDSDYGQDKPVTQERREGRRRLSWVVIVNGAEAAIVVVEGDVEHGVRDVEEES